MHYILRDYVLPTLAAVALVVTLPTAWHLETVADAADDCARFGAVDACEFVDAHPVSSWIVSAR